MVRTPEDIARSKALEIRVHPNRRHLVSGENDAPFFWQADTAWEIFHRLDEAEAKHYLDTRAKQGFNVVFAVIFAEHGGLTLPNRFGEWPFENKATGDGYVPDVFRPNPRYYDFVDAVVNHAASVGIRMALQPVWGNYVNGVYHRMVNMPFDNVDAARSYGRFCAERYPYSPWLNGGDTMRHWFPDANFNGREGGPVREPFAKVIDYGPIFDAFAQGITEGEAVHRGDTGTKPFIAFHPAARWLPDHPPAYASSWFGDRDWLTIDGIQSGHAVVNSFLEGSEPGYGRIQSFLGYDSVDAVRHMYAASPPRPCIDLEPHYESTRYNFRPTEDFWKTSNIRQGCWQAVFAGAAGLTYGVNSVWQMNNKDSKSHPPIPHGTVAEENWFDELDLPGAHQVAIATKWVNSRPSFFNRVPAQELIVSETFDRPAPTGDLDGKDGQVIAAIKAADGSWAALYTPRGAPFELDLSHLKGGGARKASWFNPRTGEENATQVPAPQTTVVPPSGGEDWVWYVEVA